MFHLFLLLFQFVVRGVRAHYLRMSAVERPKEEGGHGRKTKMWMEHAAWSVARPMGGSKVHP
jgi:hypothetical protein